jgi:hypothetical protein
MEKVTKGKKERKKMDEGRGCKGNDSAVKTSGFPLIDTNYNPVCTKRKGFL